MAGRCIFSRRNLDVIPPKAGTHSAEFRDGFGVSEFAKVNARLISVEWVPAFGGMTKSGKLE